jgi:hypothetical protein
MGAELADSGLAGVDNTNGALAGLAAGCETMIGFITLVSARAVAGLAAGAGPTTFRIKGSK